jgi:vitamin B12 transporter
MSPVTPGKVQGVGGRKPEDPGRPITHTPFEGEEEKMKGTCSNGKTWIRAALLLVVALGAPGGVVAQERAADNEATRLEPIVVTATRIPQKVSEQGSAVSVVTREEIELKAPAVAGDVLKELPGVNVQRSGSPGAIESIKIRGGKGTNVLVMIDGFPVNSPTGGGFDIGFLRLDGFERVEVVRGAQSALYGSNAMSGVVNFIPRKAEEGRKYGVGLAGGNHGSLDWSGFAQGGGRRGNLHMGVGGFESDGFLANDDTSIVSFLSLGEAAIGGKSRLHAIAFSSELDKGIPVDSTLVGSIFRDSNHRFKRRAFLRGARWETEVSKSLALEASGAVHEEFLNDNDPADPGTGDFGPVEFTIKERKTMYRLLGRVSPSRVSTTFVGVEYIKDRATDRDNFGLDLAASSFNRSVFVQEELRPVKHGGISLGARLDRNSEAGTEFNPRATAFYEFERLGVRVRGAVGRGFRVPTIVEKGDPFIGNLGLSPETAVSYEAGASLSRGGLALSATYFYQSFDDLIQFVSTGLFTGTLQNVPGAFSRGVEAEAAWRLTPAIELDLSYTYADTWDSANQRRILGTPDQRGTASMLLSSASRWQGRLVWLVESDQLDVAPDFVVRERPGFARLDAFARYRWEPAASGVREIALIGKLQNLLDRKYEERVGIPAPGINFLVGAEVKI